MAEYVKIGEGDKTVEGYAYYNPETNQLVPLAEDRLGTTQTYLRPATKEEIEGAHRGFAASTLSQKALGLGEQALGGATFGLSHSNSPEAQAREQILSQENPVLKGVARVGGALAPSLGFGLVTGGAGTALGLGRTGVGLATAATEELAMSTAMEFADAAETDRKVEVGNIAQGLIEGAAFLGGAKFLGKITKVGKAEKAVSEVADVAGDPAQALARAKNKLPTAEDVEKLSPTKKEATFYRDFKEVVDDDINSLAYQTGNRLYGREGSLQKAHGVGYKKQDIWGKMKDANGEAIADGAEAFADHLDELAAKISDPEFTSAPNVAAARSIRSHAENLRSSVAGDIEDSAVAFDQAKRHLDDLDTRFGSPSTKGTDPLRTNKRMIEEVLEPMREDLMDSAKWGKTWAEKQSKENALWSGKDGIINSRARWQEKLMEREKGAAKSYRTEDGDLPSFKMKPDDLVGRFMAMGKNERKELINALDSDISKTREMNKIKREIGGPEARKAIEEAENDLAGFKDAIDELKRVDRLDAKWGSVLSRPGKYAYGKSLVEEGLENAPLAGAVSGGPLGAAAGIAMKALKRKILNSGIFDEAVPEELNRVASIKELRLRALVNRSERVKGYASYNPGLFSNVDLTDIPKTVSDITQKAADSQFLRRADMVKRHIAAETQAINDLDQNSKDDTERAVLDLAFPDGVSPRLPNVTKRFQGDHKSLEEAYSAKMADLNRLIDDPEQFIARTTAAFQPLSDAGHPELAAKLITRMQVGMQYLRENAPPTMGQSMFNPEGSGADEIAVLQYAPVWEAVWNPLDVVRDLSSRSATPSAMKALKEVHPDVYERTMVEVFKTLAAAGPSVDFETKRYLDNVFGFGAAVGRSFSPGMSNLLAKQRQIKPGQNSLTGNNNIAPASAAEAFSKGPTSLQ